MGKEPLRALAIALFAAAAVLAGVGNSTHRGWLSALAFGAFAVGVIAFMRWRQRRRARVFDREEKTSE
jgi:peptidoglycan/LPS O-acetylase OafA/YrhL